MIEDTSARSYVARRSAAVPRGPYNTTSVVVERGAGSEVWDVDGRRYLDFAAGIGTLNVGHNHPAVVAAIHDQVDKFLHTSWHVALYPQYIQLAERLSELVGQGPGYKTILLNSGAEAVENAIKIARASTGRKAVISFQNGFHGRTLLAMSLTGKAKPYRKDFGPAAPEVYRAPFPYGYRMDAGSYDSVESRCLAELEWLFETDVDPSEVAAVIVEPVQGEGGFIMPDPSFLYRLQEMCRERQILLICDEIQTGFGRTGALFAYQRSGVQPDLVVTAKSLGGGMPISAVVGRAEVMDGPSVGALGGTYGGNPVSCAAALAVLDLFEREDLVERAKSIERRVRQSFERLAAELPERIGEVRVVGAMCAFEVVADGKSKEPDAGLVGAIIERCVEKGLITLRAGLFGNVLRILPPLNTPMEQLEEGLGILEEAVMELTNSWAEQLGAGRG